MNDRSKYISIFEDEPGVKAFFTTKYGAVEGSPAGTVFNNPEVFGELGLTDSFKVWPRQVHRTDIAVIRREDVDRLLRKETDGIRCNDAEVLRQKDAAGGIIIPETDGTLTNADNVLLTSVHADCLPVYLYDPVSRSIGLVHAGWRGASAGIAARAIAKMHAELGAEPVNTRVYIGPGISKCCFEVGGEVVAQFLENWGASFAEPDPAKAGQSIDFNSKYMLDLKAAVKVQVIEAGVTEENIGISSHCTCCEPSLFCSYRREGGTYMRMGAGICLLRQV